MILLDTNVISEALKPAPSAKVVNWLDANFAGSAISSITIFELGAGIGMLPAGKRKVALENAVARLVRRFGARVYPFDAGAAQAAAQLLGRARARGRALQQVPHKLADLQIAGIASAYGLELATRNIGDFAGLGLSLINPWDI
ncbi:type II toxin-antitoxin system VapC family toxin [Bradyrhizobium sp. STM 3809]|uniref:type II toxin-antitoxin system VapC family toxin n=1 Tax=Bradyrhizobium sp. STM 3809 TaxID=551936 RepID=UPI0002406B06|nr:type II toxin-antitoxin system VapC family toxin [Bradyrhizobium sp. STM 3809]CCD98217.1 putative Plasmid stability protein stbB [Bradyrhizobium sp. STM 3809]